MKRTVWATIMVVTLAGLVSIPMMAQEPQWRGMGRGMGMGPGGRAPGGPGGGPMGLLRGIELTDAQRDQIRAIMDQHREEAPGMKVRELDQQLQLAILADTPDPQKVDELKAAVSTAAAEQLGTRIDVETRIVQILTPAQRTQARENISKMGPPPGRWR